MCTWDKAHSTSLAWRKRAIWRRGGEGKAKFLIPLILKHLRGEPILQNEMVSTQLLLILILISVAQGRRKTRHEGDTFIIRDPCSFHSKWRRKERRGHAVGCSGVAVECGRGGTHPNPSAPLFPSSQSRSPSAQGLRSLTKYNLETHIWFSIEWAMRRESIGWSSIPKILRSR